MAMQFLDVQALKYPVARTPLPSGQAPELGFRFPMRWTSLTDEASLDKGALFLGRFGTPHGRLCGKSCRTRTGSGRACGAAIRLESRQRSNDSRGTLRAPVDLS